jgi:hypothetical protein
LVAARRGSPFDLGAKAADTLAEARAVGERDPVAIDASAGVEVPGDTVRGRSLRGLLPAEAGQWVPELFDVECGAVLRRWDPNRILTSAQTSQATDDLMAWPLRITAVPCARVQCDEVAAGPMGAGPSRAAPRPSKPWPS